MYYLIFIFVVSILWFNFVTNRIPKTGREFFDDGKEISAIITNTNSLPDHSVILRARGEDSRKYRVKLKAGESHLWIKGDEIKISVSEKNPKKYRVLFSEYFKANEPRIREHALSLLEKKIKKFSISSRAVKYDEQKLEQFKKSSINSHKVFYFTYLMKSIDNYTILSVFLTVLMLIYYFMSNIRISQLFIPAVLITGLVYYIYTAISLCTKIITDVEKELN